MTFRVETIAYVYCDQCDAKIEPSSAQFRKNWTVYDLEKDTFDFCGDCSGNDLKRNCYPVHHL